jgi:N-acetylglucosamine-6-sulfatase
MKAPRIFLLAIVVMALAIMLTPPILFAESPRPNIIFILTDDLDTEYPDNSWIDHFSRLKSLLADQGTTFKNSFVSLSLCCPSRTSMLRGQYAHNTQIFTNGAPGGGFQKLHDEGLENSTFATWLHDAGYRTILIGKYLNGYPGNVGATYIPPGWDEWFSGEKNQYKQFNYTANDNGQIKSFGKAPADYEQDVFRSKAVDFIQRMAENAQPFFMWMPTYSPHQPATFAPRHADAFPDAKAPRPPTFNQKDVSQQPSWVQHRPPLTARQIASLDALYQKRLKSMLAVEDTVQAIIETLRDTKQLDHTYIFFSSDNGFHLGQHRLPAGKNTEFEEDLHVPLIIRGPGIPSGRVLEHITLNIDFAPTFAELAGLTIPDFVDGRSLVPLLTDPGAPVERWRKAILLEHGFIQTGDVGRTPANASGDVEPPDPFDLAVAQRQMPQPFQGIHTQDLVYVEYVNTAEREMYNLRDDPYEQTNIAATANANLVSRLASWLDTLRTCAGETCREAENTPPSSEGETRSQ